MGYTEDNMALKPGTKFGPYEILASIGAGGMGEVYRARDTRLGRIVAVKVLPLHMADRPDSRERFEREARAASSLNHPHICTLFDIGRQDGTDFLVMEHLEGETLESRLARGPLPLDPALRCAIDISDALAAAHRAGITHRDLKPSNVMLTKSGPKLLDFGLAKTQSVASPAAQSEAPTQAASLTGERTIIGTLQYMAPEQIEGKKADPRTDIFAFGAMLYEMVTGKKAFEGKSQMSLLAAILESEPPPMSVLQKLTPAALEQLVRGCLAKAPDDRWQSAHDVERQLRWILEIGSDLAQPAAKYRQQRRERAVTTLATAAVLVAIVLGFILFRESRSIEETVWMSILPPHAQFGTRPTPALSPDGRQIAFWAPDPSGDVQLWVRSLDSPTVRVLAGATLGKETSNNPVAAVQPFWSPDGHSLGFFADGKLKRVDAAGGSPQTLADAAVPGGGTWNRDGVIVFAPRAIGLHRISATGGTAMPLYERDKSTAGPYDNSPQFLPDGRHFLFFRQSLGAPGAVYVGSLDSSQIQQVLSVNSRAEYADGHIFFGRNGELFAQAFNPNRFEIAGEPFRIADHLGSSLSSTLGPTFSFSASGGNIAFWSGAPFPVTRLTWYDRSGRRLGPIGEPGVYAGFDLSPNGEQAAVENWNSKTYLPEVWLIELTNGIATRFASNPAAAGAGMPLWTADGAGVLFNLFDGNFYLQKTRGSDAEKIRVGDFLIPESVSRDGKQMFFSSPTEPVKIDLAVLDLFGDRKTWIYPIANQVPLQADPSPDGRWMAYMSDESGKYEIYVQSFPRPGNRKHVSADVGLYPKWRRDGRELYFLTYRGLESILMVSTVTSSGSTIDFSLPRPLFSAPLTSDYWINDQYAPNANGDRFLFNALVDSAAPPAINVVLNWKRPAQ
jgi:serine/threonine protein kinase/Tol biopolymer transport system component